MAESSHGGKAGATSKRKGRMFHRPTNAVRSHLRKAAAAKGFAEPDVLLRWEEAVGPHLAGLCQPMKVSYGSSIGATLTVRVDGGHAPEIKHQEPQIVERINRFYGYRAISRLKLTQATGLKGPLSPRRGVTPDPSGQPGFAEPLAVFTGKPNPKSTRRPSEQVPDAAAAAKAAALTEEIQNPDLRAALERMSTWVLSNEPGQTEPAEKEI